MRKVIHHLRKKPEDVRKSISKIVTLCFAILVIFLWALGLGRDLSDEQFKTEIKEDLRPFGDLSEDMSKAYENYSGGDLE